MNHNKTDPTNVASNKTYNVTKDDSNIHKVTHKNTDSITEHHATANFVLQSTDPEIDAILHPVREAHKLIPQKADNSHDQGYRGDDCCSSI